jgi:luciferase family oxidoreductase group 1
MVDFSVLDLCPIVEGGTAAQALQNARELAVHAEGWGYRRYWVAEHHNMPGIASAATAVVIGHIAAGTRSIRVGAGGVMLPNHSPLVIAEQFGTLAALFPGRIDLGVGRAPGTDPETARALRRHLAVDTVDGFPESVRELIEYLRPARPGQRVKAIPGAGSNVPVWVLGSSLFGAELAASLGLPYAFASHFAPALLMPAIERYRTRFEPSPEWPKPHVMLGVNVVAADTDAEAHVLLTSLQQAFVHLRRGRPIPLPPPAPDFESRLGAFDRAALDEILACAAVGSPRVVQQRLAQLTRETAADELMVTCMVYDQAARLRSYEITAVMHDELARGGLPRQGLPPV